MSAKTIANYYDNWHYVEIDIAHYQEHIVWCSEVIGLRGLKWEYGTSPTKKTIVFWFKDKNDALMFILSHSGRAISKKDIKL